MPKISRRKQSKPQHICGDETNEDNKTTDNGSVGKDAVEDKNANIVVTEDQDNKNKNNASDDNQTDDIIPLRLEVEDEDEESSLRIDVTDDRNNFDTDSNYSLDQSIDSEPLDKAHLHTTSHNDRVCDYCGAVKKSPSDLARHLLKHTGEHPFKCEHCEKAFKSKRSLQHHQHAVHGISLAVSMVAIDASIPVNRKRKSDEAAGCNSSPESESKKIKSEPQELYSYPSMVYSVMSGDQQNSIYMSETSRSSTGSFKVQLTTNKPVSDDMSNKTCQVCGKLCSKPSDLKRHMMSHTGERPFRCDICGKAFRAKNSMFYHQKSSHGLNIELSPGLQERFMKLKKQNRISGQQSQPLVGFGNEDSNLNDPQMASSLLLQKLGQKVRCANNAVLYSYDINTHQEGEVELDENTGLFKQSGSIFNKPIVTPDRIKPEPLKLTNSMVGMQIVQESHNVKRHICVKNETVLITRLDGVDVLTAKDISLYKCYLCGKLFDDLLKIQCHLSMHFQKDLTLYRCQVCDDTFWFKFKVINHIRKNHPKQAILAEKETKNTDIKEKSKLNEKIDDAEYFVVEKVHSDDDEKVIADERETEKDKDQDEEVKDHIKDEVKEENQDELKDNNDEKVKDENVTDSHMTDDKDTAEDQKVKEEKMEAKDPEIDIETTSVHGDENPDKSLDITTTSNLNSTKDSESTTDVYDLSNKGRKHDPFAKLYKGIRFRKKPNGSFICLLCRKSFYKEAALLQHIKIHNQQGICYCEECGEGFMEYGKLRMHISFSHKPTEKKESPSATAKNTLLSSLLSKTTQWHRPSLDIPTQNKDHLDKAREILQREGIQEDVTVVLPSEPEDQSSNESRKANLDSILSHQETEKFVDKEPEESEIHLSPKRLLMTKLLSKSKRKSSQPVKLENPDSLDELDVHSMRSDPEVAVNSSEVDVPNSVDKPLEAINIKQEPKDNLKELSPPTQPTAEQVPTTSVPVINSELMAAKLNNLALLHPGLHPLVMANTLATLAAQGLPINTQGMFLPGISPAYPMIGIPTATTNGLFGISAPTSQPATLTLTQAQTQSQPQPLTVQIQTPEEKAEQPIVIKQEPRSPIDNFNSNSNPSSVTSNDVSTANLSGSDTEKEKLVGCPRVRWSEGETQDEEPVLEGNPSNLPSSLQQGWGYSADGRKVTSLSRTHSRLPIVSTPVDREKICKPTILPDGRTVFRCPFCSKDFLSYSDINRHMDFHEDIRPFKCKYCEYYARTNSQLKVHMMRHQGIREFCCRICNYKGVTQSDLNRHMKSQIHLLKAKNACHFCGEGFVTARNLQRHLDGNCIVKMQKLENGDSV